MSARPPAQGPGPRFAVQDHRLVDARHGELLAGPVPELEWFAGCLNAMPAGAAPPHLLLGALVTMTGRCSFAPGPGLAALKAEGGP